MRNPEADGTTAETRPPPAVGQALRTGAVTPWANAAAPLRLYSTGPQVGPVTTIGDRMLSLFIMVGLLLFVGPVTCFVVAYALNRLFQRLPAVPETTPGRLNVPPDGAPAQKPVLPIAA